MISRTFNTPIVIGDNQFNVWIASTSEELELGLMGYHLQTNQGCWLKFPYSMEISLWMKNCMQPLGVLFLDETDTVVEKQLMDNSEPNRIYRSNIPCSSALEIHPSKLDLINVGDKIEKKVQGSRKLRMVVASLRKII